MKERREIDEVFLKQEPMLKHNLPVEILGDPPPPKGDPVFALKPLPDNLKYALLEICPRGNNKLIIIIFPCS